MDIEKDLLAHLTTDQGMKVAWDRGVRPEQFMDPTNRAIYQFALEYWFDSSMTRTPTPEVLSHEFPSFHYSEPEETVTWLSEKIQQRYVTNELQNVLRESASKAAEEPLEALDRLYTGAWEVRQKTTPRINRSDMAESVEKRRQRYAERAAYGGEVRGAPMGLGVIDDHTSGILPGELAVVAGYAKTGKSHFLCNAVKGMRQAGWTPYFATLELSVAEMEDRMDAHISGFGYERLQKGTLQMDELDEFRKSQEDFARLGSTFIEKPQRGERTVPHLVNRARELGADVLVIDQLSFLEARGNHREKTYMIEEIMEDLKSEISQDESNMMPCLMAVQFNRGAQQLKEGRAGMDNFANSSSIERTVDMAIGLTQSKEMRANRSMVAEIVAGRRTAPGAWLLEWQLGQTTRIGVRGELEE